MLYSKLGVASFFVLLLLSAFAVADKAVSTSYSLFTENIYSKVLKETRIVTVQLPKSYSANPNKRYPIIYRLDGVGNLSMMNAVLEGLQSQLSAPEVIIVAIENTDRLRDLYPTVNQNPAGPVGAGGGAAKFLEFITSELMPMVESKYRTHDYRVISGASAAGVFALYAMQQRIDLFDAVLAFSPAVWWADGASGKATVEFLKKTDKLDHYIYTSIGNEPSPMRPYYDDMIAGFVSEQPDGLRWVNETYDNVPHNLVSSASSFSAYHNLFYSEYMQAHDFNGELSSIDNYYAKVSEQHGTKMVAPEWVIRQLGYHFVTQGDHEQAAELFKYGISQYPDSPDAHNGLAYGYEQTGKLEEALIAVNKALKLAPKDYDGYQVYKQRQERLIKQISKQ